MNKQFFIGGIVGGIAFFLLGWLFYGILLMDVFAGMAGSAINVEKEPMDFISLFIGQLSWSFLLAYVFANWSKTTNAADGAKNGAIIGLFTGIGFDMTMYGTSNFMLLNGTLLDIVLWTAICAISGAIIAWVMGKVK